jgi:TonB family protein
MQMFLVLLALSGGLQSPPQNPDSAARLTRCFVSMLRGAATPDGADATIIVVSDGLPCGIANFGMPAVRQNGATEAVVTEPPKHGTVAFVAPRIEYRAERAYVGEDRFAYEAQATGPNGVPVTLRVRVKADVRAAPFAQAAPEPAPIRIGPGIPAPQRIKNVNPVYPADARTAGVQGTVVIEATIGSDGHVRDAVVRRSIPQLDAAALDAVRQWEFRPTVVNGRAVPIIMTVTVNFSVSGPGGAPAAGGTPAPGGAPAGGSPPGGPVLPNVSNIPLPRIANPDFESGRQSLERKQYEDALRSFRRASDTQGRQCAACFFGMALAYDGLGAYKNAVESCDRALDFAGDDRRFVVDVRQTKGLALQRLAELKDEKKLREAESEFRAALSIDPDAAYLHFHLGVVLMQQFRDVEGVDELKRELALRPKSVNSDTAGALIANPRRAREAYAPEFSIVTESKELLELANLRGKVVVLAFWATWCQVCVQTAIPWLRDIQKRHARDPFVMIGMSEDNDERVMREFIAANRMDWAQYWDRDRKIQQRYEVRSWPTFVVIDDEGIARFRAGGYQPTVGARLEDEIRRELKAAASRNKP